MGRDLFALLDTQSNLLKQRNKAKIIREDFPVKNYECKNNAENIAAFEQGPGKIMDRKACERRDLTEVKVTHQV